MAADFEQEWLIAAGIVHELPLHQQLSDDWTEEEIRYAYERVSSSVLQGHPKPEQLHILADMDGRSVLYKIGEEYLFESIDRWFHEVIASPSLMQRIIAAMSAMRKPG